MPKERGSELSKPPRRSARFRGCFAGSNALEQRVLLSAHIVGSAIAYATIQAAIDAAAAGATITVDAGTYAERVSITKSLTLKGAQAGVDARQSGRPTSSGVGESIVTGSSSSGVTSTAFYINANDVTIDGFTVQGETDSSLTSGAGIVIAPNRFGTHIINNIVQQNVAGLFLANNSSSDPAVIQYNLFRSNNKNGQNGGRGIYTDQGIAGSSLTNVTIDSNTFINNYGGDGTTGLEAACAFESTAAGRQSNIRITNNTMSGNGKAVLFYNATNIVIRGNTITTTQDQYSGTLRFEGNVQTVSVQYNTIYNNTGPAVSVDSKATEGDSSGFVVTYNNLYGNNAAYSVPISVVFTATQYNGVFDARNNWWGNASGPSGNGPGTGDAASAGVFQPGTGLGWKLTTGGNLLYSPWSTATNVQPGIVPTAPTNLTARASGLAQITLAWADTAAGVASGFAIQRSVDGITFTPIATTAAGVTRFVDTGLAAGQAYTYRVVATNANGASPASGAAGDVLPLPGATSTNLSALAWTSATTGYGSVQKDLSIAGRPLTLNGIVYGTGIGTHALSNISYNLAGGYSNFMSDVGIDAEENGKGTGYVSFQVVGDGRVLYDSGVLFNPSAPVSLNVNVAGVKTLTLIATNGIAGNIDYDHADWAGAKLITAVATTPPIAPGSLTGVAVSATQINLTWTGTSSSLSGYVIQRSVDGTNFTQIATTTSDVTTYTDRAVTASSTYAYRVAAMNSVGLSPFTTSVAVVTPAATAVTTALSSLNWSSATIGYGSVQKNHSVGGNPLKLNGVTYASGIGTHAVSNIVYILGRAYTNFLADIGVDSEVVKKGTGYVDFKVVGDNGVTLYDSGVLSSTSATVSINVNVTGVNSMTLVATNGIANNIDYDHADWANARLLSSPPQQAAASVGQAMTLSIASSRSAAKAAVPAVQASRDLVVVKPTAKPKKAVVTSPAISAAAKRKLAQKRKQSKRLLF